MEMPSSSMSELKSSKTVRDEKGPVELHRLNKTPPTVKIPFIGGNMQLSNKTPSKQGDIEKNESGVAKKSCSKGPISGNKETIPPKRPRLDTAANTNSSIKYQSTNVKTGTESRNDHGMISKNRMTRSQLFSSIMNSEVPYMKTGWEKWDKKLGDQKEKELEKNKTPTRKIGPNSIVINPGLGKIKLETDYIPPEIVKTENEVEPSEKPEDAAINNPQFETQTVPLKKSVPLNDDDKDALEKVDSLNEKVKSLELKIQEFEFEGNGIEIFTQNFNYLGGILAILDNIKADGRDSVQNGKVNCVKSICKCVAALGSKVTPPDSEILIEKGNSSSGGAIENIEIPLGAPSAMEMQNEEGSLENFEDTDMNDTEAETPENSISLNDGDNEDTVDATQIVRAESNVLELQIQELERILKENLIKLNKKNIKKDERVDCVQNAKQNCELIYNCISKLESKLRLDILNIISFLCPKNIPSHIVLKILEKMGKMSSVANVENIFDEIQQNSMIDFCDGKLSVHPIVQETTRNELAKREEFCLVLAGVDEVLIDMFDTNEIDLKDVVHAQAVCDHLSKKKEMIKNHGELFAWICSKLYNSGKYKNTLDFSRKSEKVLDSTLGRNTRLALDVKCWKGIALRSLGKYCASLKVLNDVYKSQKAIFGEDDENCLETAEELGMTFYKLKKYEQAMKIFEAALEKREGVNGNDHPSTLDLKIAIIDVLESQNNFKRALKLSKEILEVYERKFGVEHEETLVCKHNVAYFQYLQYKYRAALRNFKELLEIQERVLELNHPDTFLTKSFIAETYNHLGRHKESLKLAKELHAVQVEKLGPQHPDTIDTQELIQKVEADIAITMQYVLE